MADMERMAEHDLDDSSLLDTGIRNALKGIADIKALSEERGRDETTATALYQSALNDELRQVRQKAGEGETPEPTFGQRNKALARRRTRSVGSRLLHGR